MRVLAGLILSAVTIMGCGNSTPSITCDPPTVLNQAGTACDYVGSDMSATVVTCGTNTAPNDMGTECEVQPGTCQAQGTVYDPATHSCKQQPSGTSVEPSRTLVPFYTQVYYNNSSVYSAIGAGPNITATGVDDTTQLFNVAGVKLGGRTFMTRAPGITPPGSGGPFTVVPTTLDINRQLTLGDWKKCSGSIQWFTPPPAQQPSTGNKLYKQVIDIAGCIPNSMYSAWLFWTPDGTFANRAFAAVAGGLPNVLITDGSGAGHFEAFYDPAVWFKIGTNVTYAAAHTPPTVVFDPANASYTNSGVITTLFYHSSGQSNDNIGYCEKDIDAGVCITPQPQVLNMLAVGVWAHAALSQYDATTPTNSATKIGLLQPY